MSPKPESMRIRDEIIAAVNALNVDLCVSNHTASELVQADAADIVLGLARLAQVLGFDLEAATEARKLSPLKWDPFNGMADGEHK
jgi:hypothetical protein